MKLFLDSADIDEIRSTAETGLLDGLTTNPSLVAKQGQSFDALLKEITQLVPGPISAEVISTEKEGMLQEAEKLVQIADQIVIKVPLTKEGLKACKELNSQGVKVNVTLCFSPLQALLAAKAGATYVSPFIGRLDDVGHEGTDLIEQMVQIFDQYGFETQILAASIRHPVHVLQSALAGADVATLPYKVFTQLFQHPLTDKGLEKFLSDWKKLKA